MKKSKKVLIISAYAMALGLILAAAAYFSGAKITSVRLGGNGVEIMDTTPHTLKNENIAAFSSI